MCVLPYYPLAQSQSPGKRTGSRGATANGRQRGAMSKGGAARGRSAEPAARPPQLDFDKLMTAVGQAAAEPHAQRPPLSARRAEGRRCTRPGSAREAPRGGAGGAGTPREIMAAAVQELPSLVDTLQAGSWVTSQEAAG